LAGREEVGNAIEAGVGDVAVAVGAAELKEFVREP
jgi:hypothetical protein